jgi:hypothetical protein
MSRTLSNKWPREILARLDVQRKWAEEQFHIEYEAWIATAPAEHAVWSKAMGVAAGRFSKEAFQAVRVAEEILVAKAGPIPVYVSH